MTEIEKETRLGTATGNTPHRSPNSQCGIKGEAGGGVFPFGFRSGIDDLI